MLAEPQPKTIASLIALYKNHMLRANPEYQRGVVWSTIQKRKLIDSVLRGYPLPMIYLHHIKTDVDGLRREDLEVIDGQQRITALYEYAEGAFKLFDPVKDEKIAKFPAFIKAQPCAWAGKNFDELSDEIKKQFLETSLSVAMIQTNNSNEVRDLFVRLQSGLPLNSQETRDAWPGAFTDYILKLGGKPELARYPGHDFFTRTMGLKPAGDRGKVRQLAAQIATIFFQRRRSPEHYVDINSASLNDFYYSNLDFDSNSDDAVRLRSILDRISNIVIAKKHAKLKGHDAIHLVLLVDSLWDDYTPAWAEKLPKALDEFSAMLAAAKIDRESETPSPYWQHYGQWTRVNSDRGETIARRHRFYTEKMLAFMGPLSLKDPNRLFGEAERTVLFHRQGKRCAVCEASVDWDQMEVHHVEEHSQGGPTKMANGAVVHKVCHPKGAAATAAFAEKFKAMSFPAEPTPPKLTAVDLLELVGDDV